MGASKQLKVEFWVSKGALVVMNAKRSRSLYILQGFAIISLAVVSSSMLNLIVTKLWHMSLGHMSEKG